MTQIRVLRILEYVYDSPERAEEDQKRWTQSYFASNGSMSMTSTTLPFSTLPDVPEPNTDPIETCGYWDGPDEHVYGICQRPPNHPGRHVEMRDGQLWAAWSGGEPGPAPRPSLKGKD